MTRAGALAGLRAWLGSSGPGSGSLAPGAHLEAMLALSRSGPVALRGDSEQTAGASLSLACVIPSFRRGSGGHATIVALLNGLRELGHRPSLWLEDCEGRHVRESAELIRGSFAEFFGADQIPLHTDFASWSGADVVIATGWQTVARALLLEGAGARAYLVQDHEPDFYAASAESLWAAQTYRMGLPCIAASPWLAALLRDRYGASATHFDLALDHSVYRPTGTVRRDDLVVFYARSATARRAVPLGLLALSDLSRRRPGVEIGLFGEPSGPGPGFPASQLGVLGGPALAELYSRAAVGVVLSLTNPSLVCLEMMACGLPCVELASDSMVSSFGVDGPLRLREAEPAALRSGIEELLGDRPLREEIGAQGVALVGARTWHGAALQVQEGLRAAVAHALS